MSLSNNFREYENGIADIFSVIAGDRATVQRNIMVPSALDGRKRQIDILVEGTIFGLTDARMIVDCKCWKTAIDVGAVDRFIGMIDDVKADMGMLVSATGATSGAMARAAAARGVRVQPVSLAELQAWSPVGTVVMSVELQQADVARAAKALRKAGLRVTSEATSDSELAEMKVFRHYGISNPSAEMQQGQHALTFGIFEKLGLVFREVSHGVVFGGGTPSHRWLQVRANGIDFVKILVASDAEVEEKLSRFAIEFEVPRDILEVERPDGWPFTGSF